MMMPKTFFMVSAPLLYVRQVFVCHFLRGKLRAAADAYALSNDGYAPLVHVAVSRAAADFSVCLLYTSRCV